MISDIKYHKGLTPDQIDAFEERAAIMEYDGGYSREYAEYLAFRALRDDLAIAQDISGLWSMKNDSRSTK